MKTNRKIPTAFKTILVAASFLSFFMQKSFGQSADNDLSQNSKIYGADVKYQVHKQANFQYQTGGYQKQNLVKALPAEKQLVVAPSKTMTQNIKALPIDAYIKDNAIIAIPDSINKIKVD